ncbi:MAG: aminotransferase class V-fold PLP-dependent enzyme [Acidimicrobiia bacterium]
MTVAAGRFPGAHDGWARFDGPGGTLMVDVAIEAMRRYLESGDAANLGGAFAASHRTDELVQQGREAVARLLGTTADGIVFGANMTTLTFAFTRAVGRSLVPGDEIVCTELDHDANVTPWALMAGEHGARVALAELDPESGTLPVEAVVDRITERTRWVAVTGASNLVGTTPDLVPMIEAAHAAGARVYVDAVALVPHRRVDVSALGCDALVTSPYKWYGPHAGVLALTPELVDEVEPYRVRPAPNVGPGRLETGTKSFESIAAIEAAADFLRAEHDAGLADEDAELFVVLLDGLLSMSHLRIVGPRTVADRTPTVLVNVDGVHPDEVVLALARDRVAAWSGANYAVETARALGIADTGSGVRLGLARYTTPEDVQRVLRAIDGLR